MAFPKRSLGISLGTRKMGVAVMERTSIFDCQMKAFHNAWSDKKHQVILATIERYIVHYSVAHVAVKVPTFSVGAPAVLEVLEGIERLCKEIDVPISICSLADLKKGWCGSQRANKKELMRCILERHPELQREYNKEDNNKINYYDKLFEAVAATNILLN